MSDAFTSFPLPGQMEGNVRDVGAFYSCMEIDLAEERGFGGRYCRVTHLPISVDLGQDDGDAARMNPLLPDFENVLLNTIEVLIKDVSFKKLWKFEIPGSIEW